MTTAMQSAILLATARIYAGVSRQAPPYFCTMMGLMRSANELRQARLQAFPNTNATAVHARPVFSNIIRRESHWQSRLLRNDRH
jgi:hypothetical protein